MADICDSGVRHSGHGFPMRAFHVAVIVLILAACAAGALSFASVPKVQAPAQWTQFRLDDGNNAVVPGTLEVSWRTTTGASYSSSPTIGGTAIFIGDNAGALRALDAETGKILWTAHVSNPLMSAPLIVGDQIIVGEGNENSPGAASPAHPIHVGDGSSALLAFARGTGTLRWRVPLPGSAMPTGAIVDGALVHHNGSGSVYGLDPQTGSIRYSRDLHSIASMTAALPLSGGRFVTIGEDANAVWILDARTGTTIARTAFAPNASGLGDCPPVTNGRIVFCNYIMPPYGSVPVQTERQANERAYAVDLSTGKKLWDVYIENGTLPRRNEAAIPLYAYGTFYCGSSVAPYVHAFDPSTGKLRWRTKVHGPVLGGIVAVKGTLYFGDLAGYLWAVNANTGAVIGDVDEHTPFNVGSPIVAGNTLIDASRGGTVVAVPLNTIRAGG